MDECPLRELAGEREHFLCLEGDDTAGERDEGIVGDALHVRSRMELRAALADDDIADFRCLSAGELDAETLGDGIATVRG